MSAIRNTEHWAQATPSFEDLGSVEDLSPVLLVPNAATSTDLRLFRQTAEQ